MSLLILLPRLAALLYDCEAGLLPRAEPCKKQPEPAEPVKWCSGQAFKLVAIEVLVSGVLSFQKLAACIWSLKKVETERQAAEDCAGLASQGCVGGMKVLERIVECAVQYCHFAPQSAKIAN